jgi:MIP family channel proteins
LTYTGSWAIIFEDIDDLGDEGTGFAHGIALAILTWACWKVSGAHFNPAVTLGMVVIRKIEWSVGIFYMITQFIAGIFAGYMIDIQITDQIRLMISNLSLLGLPRADSGQFDVSGIWIEMFGTFVLVYVYSTFMVDTKKGKPIEVFPFTIGMIYFLCYITIGDVSGGGFNPARALGPAIAIGKVGNTQFIQFFGPLIGGIMGALVYHKVFIDEDDTDEDVEVDMDEIKEYVQEDDDEVSAPAQIELH